MSRKNPTPQQYKLDCPYCKTKTMHTISVPTMGTKPNPNQGIGAIPNDLYVATEAICNECRRPTHHSGSYMLFIEYPRTPQSNKEATMPYNKRWIIQDNGKSWALDFHEDGIRFAIEQTEPGNWSSKILVGIPQGNTKHYQTVSFTTHPGQTFEEVTQDIANEYKRWAQSIFDNIVGADQPHIL